LALALFYICTEKYIFVPILQSRTKSICIYLSMVYCPDNVSTWTEGNQAFSLRTYCLYWAIPFNVHTPYGREFLSGFEKAVSEGLCASASFDLRKNFLISGGCLCRHFDLFFLGVQIVLNSSIGGCVH
jgi:hypothetical protein